MPEKDVNFIQHVTMMQEIFIADDRLSSWHVSLYHALFHIWNQARFRNPISINRTDVMNASKIGSANTYSKCIKELHNWGYFEYLPSKNPHRGSRINMYRFDTCSDICSDTCTDTSAVHVLIHLLRPYINNTNYNKQNKQEKESSFRRPGPVREVQKDEGQSENRPKRFSPPPIEELNEFFLLSGSTPSEAENFFNYFESNGWLVGGKAKMKNWHAAATNWIKRSEEFKKRSPSPPKPSNDKPDKLHINQNKDYSMPL